MQISLILFLFWKGPCTYYMSDKFQRDLVDQILCYQNNLVLIAWLQGRTITVKLADTHKSKTVQMQSPAPMVPVPVPMAAAGYVQPGKAPVGSGTPVGYPYHQTVASYPASSYPNPPVAPAPYPTQSQVSYAPVSAKKELLGLSSTPPVGMGGYPYYYPKQ